MSEAPDTSNLDKPFRLTTLGLPDGSLIDLDLDIADRPTHIHHPLGALSYDYQSGSGRLASIQTHDGINLDYQYDGPLPTAVSWSGPVFGSYSIHYDNYLRPTRTYINDTYPINYTYDHDGLLTFAGDLYLGRNRENGLLETTLLGSFIDSITYNQFAEPSSLTTTYNNSRIYQNSYDRDALGRIVARTETILETTHTYAYTFDSADRLETVTTDGIESARYTYDTNGNRLSKTTGGYTESGSYDDQDRLVSYAGCLYDHNPNGQVTRKSCLDGLTDYTYDVLGNLRQAVLPDGQVIEYLIDGQNRRIGRKVGGILVQGLLYQDQLEPVAELDGGGNIVSRFVYGSRPNVPDYFIKNGETYRIVADHLGSVRLVVDPSGVFVQRMEYDEWGQVLFDSNPGFQPFGYAGGIYDDVTGLVRFGVRDYDPLSGRWMARDSIEHAGRSTNLYVYTNQDPVNSVDIDGMELLNGAQLMAIGNFSAGLGDALLFGQGERLRRLLEIGGVNTCSLAYSAGAWASFAIGLGRIGYALAAKGLSVFAVSGAAASTARQRLKVIFRFGIGRKWRLPEISGLADDLVRIKAGRTNLWINGYGAGVAVSGAAGSGGL